MRILVVYSSRTGNTKKVAEAIFSAMPLSTVLSPVNLAPCPVFFDCVIMGFWNRRAAPDTAMLKFMEGVRGKKVGLFATQGAWPDSDHSRRFMDTARQAVSDNEVLAEFVCMGKVDPALLEMEAALPPALRRHSMTEERQLRLQEAEKHPDEHDLVRAKEIFRNMVENLCSTTPE